MVEECIGGNCTIIERCSYSCLEGAGWAYCAGRDIDPPEAATAEATEEVNYNTSPKELSFKWRFKGKPEGERDEERVYRMKLTMFGGLYGYYADKRPLAYTEEEYYLQYVNDEKQQYIIKQIVKELESYKFTPDDTARLIVSFVAQIPYNLSSIQKYPYVTLYTQAGVCSDKALLAAALLKEYGYATALLLFEEENHMALGVKCAPLRINVRYGDYCFTEVSNLYSRIGTLPDDYEGVGEITSAPRVIVVSEGMTYGENYRYLPVR